MEPKIKEYLSYRQLNLRRSLRKGQTGPQAAGEPKFKDLGVGGAPNPSVTKEYLTLTDE